MVNCQCESSFSSLEGIGEMAPGVQAVKADQEKQLQSLQQVNGAKLRLLQPNRTAEAKLSDEKVAELAMFILM
jgi:hypothetical protein